MKPIDKARELAHCDTCITCDESNCFIPSKNCILKIDLSIAMQMHEWDKEQFIKKACESFCENCRQDNCELTECLDLYGFKEKLLKKL